MFNLKIGYLLSGIITGCILLVNFFSHLPDGKLHIVFCDVGQGDATYIQFPGGRDMLIDGGPGGQTPKVLGCLARHMSIFDRTIDVVLLSHPEEDHMGGVQEIVRRYTIGTFVTSGQAHTIAGFAQVHTLLQEKHVLERIVGANETITIGSSQVSVLWPPSQPLSSSQQTDVLGATHINDMSVVVKLSYGLFDVLFPGDIDSRMDGELTKQPLLETDGIEVLKVPHHGAKTSMTQGFYRWLRAVDLAVISVGKNSFGHPDDTTIQALERIGATVQRTDTQGDIEVTSDGTTWGIVSQKTTREH